LGAQAFADHTLKPLGNQARSISIHPAAGGGSSRAYYLAWPGWGGSHVVHGCPLDIEGQWLALVESLDHPLVSGVPGNVDDTGEQEIVPGFEVFQDFIV
jgi:hypothetical protein